MVHFAVGDVVLLPFPYSDQKKTSVRPAFVVQASSHGDALVGMITTHGYGDPLCVAFSEQELRHCHIERPCVVRYSKLITIEPDLFIKKIGSASPEFTRRIHNAIIEWIRD